MWSAQNWSENFILRMKKQSIKYINSCSVSEVTLRDLKVLHILWAPEFSNTLNSDRGESDHIVGQ